MAFCGSMLFLAIEVASVHHFLLQKKDKSALHQGQHREHCKNSVDSTMVPFLIHTYSTVLSPQQMGGLYLDCGVPA